MGIVGQSLYPIVFMSILVDPNPLPLCKQIFKLPNTHTLAQKNLFCSLKVTLDPLLQGLVFLVVLIVVAVTIKNVKIITIKFKSKSTL